MYDKKVYVWADDGGEKVQIAISLTCPKIPIGEVTTNFSGDLDFENMAAVVAPSSYEPAEITEEEKQNIADLMARLGL